MKCFQMIKFVCLDKSVRIWRVSMENGKWQGNLMSSFTDHNSEVFFILFSR